MNILSFGIFAWSVWWVTASTNTQIPTVFGRFNRTLANLNESFNEFTSLLGFVPVEGLDHSVQLVKSIHLTTFQLVYDIYETVRHIFEHEMGITNDPTEDDSYRRTMRETEKMESYSAGLLKDLQAVRNSVLGLTTESAACPYKAVLPIGPPRVYQLYPQRSADTTRDSNATDVDNLIKNVKIAVEAEGEALATIGQILLQLPLNHEPTWGRREGTVAELINKLLGSIKTIVLQEMSKFAVSEHDFEITGISILSLESITARIHAEALKECLLSLTPR